MFIATIRTFYKSYITQPRLVIDIKVQDELVNDLDIFIVPEGYLLEGHEIISSYNNIGEITPLYSKGELLAVIAKNLTSYSDYRIYAKYKDKYAIISSTNDLVMGSKNTHIFLYVKKVEDLLFISTGDSIPEYSLKPQLTIYPSSYFYSIEDFEVAFNGTAPNKLYDFGQFMSKN